MTSKPLVRRTFATLRSAELGFLGVVVYTRVQTPRFCGDPCRAGAFPLACCLVLPCFTSWLIVGIEHRWKNGIAHHRRSPMECQHRNPYATASGAMRGDSTGVSA